VWAEGEKQKFAGFSSRVGSVSTQKEKKQKKQSVVTKPLLRPSPKEVNKNWKFQ